MKVGSKGQVTIFILVGILILLIAGILFYLRNGFIDNSNVLDYAPEDLLPLEKYMVQCLESTARDGLQLMGLQGGYITLPAEIYSRADRYIQDIPGGYKLPLWKIGGQYQYPDLEVMSEQLSRYVENNILTCAQAVIELDSVQEIEIRSEPKANVSINKEDVSVILDLKLTAIYDQKKTTYEKYGVRMDVKLYDILQTASYVLQKNDADLFLATSTLNIMALDPDIPIGDMRFSCQPMIWSKLEITSRLQEYLRYMIPRVRLSGTDFVPFNEPLAVYERFEEDWDVDRIAAEGLPNSDDMPSDIYDYMQQYWDVGDYNYNGLNVGFSYNPGYPMRMQISPSSGDLVKAIPGKATSKYLQYLCINIYHFTYDVMFPVRVSLYDDSAFGGSGYTFSFALPVNIESNIPSTYTPDFYSSEAYETDEDFCNATHSDKTYIAVKDYYTGSYLSNVNVKYDCFKYYCSLGKVSSEYSYNIPELQTYLPLGCTNGFYIAEKDGYLRSRQQVNEEKSIELDLVPLQNFNYEVFPLGLTKPFSEDYTTSIYIKSKTHDFESFYSYPSKTGSKTLQLIRAPEEYELEMFLYNNGNIVGGWIGNWSVSAADLSAKSVIFYPYEEPYLVSHYSPEGMVALYQYLQENPENDPYRNLYVPEFR